MVKIINSLGIVDGLCFGVENGDKENYIRLADAMNDESKEFKRALKEQLDKGVSLAKAKFLAVQSMGSNFDENLVSTPNNILGLEYVKALRKLDKNNIKVYRTDEKGTIIAKSDGNKIKFETRKTDTNG